MYHLVIAHYITTQGLNVGFVWRVFYQLSRIKGPVGDTSSKMLAIRTNLWSNLGLSYRVLLKHSKKVSVLLEFTTKESDNPGWSGQYFFGGQ